jgi:hypothetical protein
MLNTGAELTMTGAELTNLRCRFDCVDRCRNDQVPIWPDTDRARMPLVATSADSVPSSYWGSEADSPEVCRLARMHYCIRNFGAFLRRVDNMFHLKLPERFTCWLAKQPANRKCNQTVPLHFSSQATLCTLDI